MAATTATRHGALGRAPPRKSCRAPSPAEARRPRQAGCTGCQSMAPSGQPAQPELTIDAYLQVLLDQAASDLILSAGAPATMRKDGALVPLDPQPLRPEQIEQIAREVLSGERWKRFQERRGLGFSFNWRCQA